MLFEPTTIAGPARLMGETLKTNYSQDPMPVYLAAGIDPSRLDVSGARYPYSAMQRLWQACVDTTGDPCFGLVAGKKIRPTTFHALGFSWIASRTLLESLQRFVRYSKLLSTAPALINLQKEGELWMLEDHALQEGKRDAHPAALDAFFMAVVSLCRQASDAHFCPAELRLCHPDYGQPERYIEAFNAPVLFNRKYDRILFHDQDLEKQLPGDNLELALANDRIAEDYIAALDPNDISTEVRKILIELLPSGEANQQQIAQHMNRSLSTLQRQLSTEGTSYKIIREQTRQELAEQYVREGRYSLSQVAYLLGFSDQSNFSRAFRRWTGHSPGNYARH